MERTEVSTQQALREEEGAGGATCTARDDQLGGRGLDQGEDLLDRFNFSALQTTSATVRACGTCSGLATKREERNGRGGTMASVPRKRPRALSEDERRAARVVYSAAFHPPVRPWCRQAHTAPLFSLKALLLAALARRHCSPLHHEGPLARGARLGRACAHCRCHTRGWTHGRKRCRPAEREFLAESRG